MQSVPRKLPPIVATGGNPSGENLPSEQGLKRRGKRTIAQINKDINDVLAEMKAAETPQVASQIKDSELVPLHHELDRDSVDAYYDRLDGWYRLCRNSNYDRYFLKDKDGG